MAGLYNILDRVLTSDPATLATNIDSGDTTIALTTGDGSKLPSSNGLVLLVQFNDQSGTYRQAQASGPSKYELIEYTTRSTDTLSGITRGKDPTSGQSFTGGSYVLNVISKHHYDRQNEHIRAGYNPFTTEVKR